MPRRTRGRRSALLERIDVLTAIPSFVWSPRTPRARSPTPLGLEPRATRVTFPGGTVAPVRRSSTPRPAIAAGELDVAVDRRRRGDEEPRPRAARRRARPRGTTQGEDVAAADVVFEIGRPTRRRRRARRGPRTARPHLRPLRARASTRRAGCRATRTSTRLDALAARMRAVAATQRRRLAPASADAGGRSRRVADEPDGVVPLHEAAHLQRGRRHGGGGRRLLPRGGARARGCPTTGSSSRRAAPLRARSSGSSRRAGSSLAPSRCARAPSPLFGERTPSVDELAHLDLYSCFPSAVQLGADALGIDVLADERPPTVTGGMTFFGGPGNNYVTHSIAAMARALRGHARCDRPRHRARVVRLDALVGHVLDLAARGGFVAHDVQAAVDAVPLRAADASYEGDGEVESYTVVPRPRAAGPTRAIVSLLHAGRRAAHRRQRRPRRSPRPSRPPTRSTPSRRGARGERSRCAERGEHVRSADRALAHHDRRAPRSGRRPSRPRRRAGRRRGRPRLPSPRRATTAAAVVAGRLPVQVRRGDRERAGAREQRPGSSASSGTRTPTPCAAPRRAASAGGGADDERERPGPEPPREARGGRAATRVASAASRRPSSRTAPRRATTSGRRFAANSRRIAAASSSAAARP